MDSTKLIFRSPDGKTLSALTIHYRPRPDRTPREASSCDYGSRSESQGGGDGNRALRRALRLGAIWEYANGP